MAQDKISSFTLTGLVVPRINSVFIDAPTQESFLQAFRVEVFIPNDSVVKVLLGTKVTSEENFKDGTPLVDIVVEAIADFQLADYTIPSVKQLADVPNLSNMLAIVYPFLREKVYSCLAANNFSSFLPPLNLYNLLDENKNNPNFKIVDGRVNSNLESSSNP